MGYTKHGSARASTERAASSSADLSDPDTPEMPDTRHLNYAPITEAIFDIRVKARPGFDPHRFASLKPKLADSFPKVDDRVGKQFTFQLTPAGPRPPEIQDLGLQGYFFKSQDEKLIAQFRIDGFTLNRLRPYTSWGELFPVAQELWGLYVETAEPERATRVATRYINKITLPPNPPELTHYLSTPPRLPANLDAEMLASLTRTTIRYRHRESSAHVTQALNLDESSGTWTLLLDIDTFSDVSLLPGDSQLVALFAQLRKFKNMIFFSWLTESAIGVYE